MENRITVVLADANEELRAAMEQAIRSAGEFNVVGCTGDGPSALQLLETHDPQLLVMDLLLPGLDGFTVLERLRGSGSRLPVLMLTARGELSDRVCGLDRGADYYLTKPFQSPELLACVRLLLRRQAGTATVDDTIRWGDLQLQPGSFQVCCQERSARLSRKEYDLLEMLMRNGGQILSKEQLLLKAWGYDSDAEDNNVEVYISFLRRKLALIRSAVQIKTVRMVGYYLEEAK
mgnify:CR=1 FL=1